MLGERNHATGADALLLLLLGCARLQQFLLLTSGLSTALGVLYMCCLQLRV
jgi:hypothetical protein